MTGDGGIIQLMWEKWIWFRSQPFWDVTVTDVIQAVVVTSLAAMNWAYLRHLNQERLDAWNQRNEPVLNFQRTATAVLNRWNERGDWWDRIDNGKIEGQAFEEWSAPFRELSNLVKSDEIQSLRARNSALYHSVEKITQHVRGAATVFARMPGLKIDRDLFDAAQRALDILWVDFSSEVQLLATLLDRTRPGGSKGKR